MKKINDDYPLKFYVIRIINIFSALIFNFFMLIDVDYYASYFLLIFYFWILVAISFIEFGYVIYGSKKLFNLHRTSNIIFISIYFSSILSVLYHYLF